MNNIGLLVDTNENKFVFNEPYWHFANQFGRVQLINPLNPLIEEDLDLLILPGGADVWSGRYGPVGHPSIVGTPNYNFEYFDSNILPQYIEQNTAIFGICRGIQTLNVHFGGTLFHDLDDEPKNGWGDNRGKFLHHVRNLENNDVFPVNSLHHQAVETLGEGLIETLRGFLIKDGKEIGLQIEGLEHEHLPISAVQWHPEEVLANWYSYNPNVGKGRKTSERQKAAQALSWVKESINKMMTRSRLMRGLEVQVENRELVVG